MPELIDLAERVAGEADEAAGEQVEVYVSRSRQTSVRAFGGAVEHLSSAEPAGIGVRIVRQHRQGFAWVASVGEAPAREALSEARDNVAYASADEHAGLASPDGVDKAPVDPWHQSLAEFPSDKKVELAVELERLVRASDNRIRQVVSSDYSDSMVEAAIATSTGISGSTRRSVCHLFVYAVAGEAEGTQTGLGYSVARGPDDLDLEACARDAVLRATRMLGAVKPKSSQQTAVFDRRVAATLLGRIAKALSGDEVSKGRSLFANRIGEAVASSPVTLRDNPTDDHTLGATPFDAEGLATRCNELIAGGKLMGYLYGSRSARVASTASTGSAVRGSYRTVPGTGPRAISLSPGKLTQEQIIGDVKEGVFIQSISGINSGLNTVSGDFSVGAEGLMIRGGQLAEPVREMTVASTIQKMLQQVRHVGADLEWLPGVAAGVTLAIDGVSLGGK